MLFIRYPFRDLATRDALRHRAGQLIVHGVSPGFGAFHHQVHWAFAQETEAQNAFFANEVLDELM